MRRWQAQIAAAALSVSIVLVGGSAYADGKKGKTDAAPANGAAGPKSKTYTFTGLDIDGKLKTPQLLYFLNRMKSEFDSTTPDHRSFIPELERSTSEM